MNSAKDQIKQLVPIANLLNTTDKRILCPLPGHRDKSPSCDVNHQQGLWHCKVCDVGGDIFSLLMHRDRMSFVDALKHLAQLANVPLEQTAEAQERWEKEKRIQLARRYAVDYYHKNLLEHQAGINYLSNRGISLNTIKKMKLGWSDGGLVRSAKKVKIEGCTFDDFIAAGLAVDSQTHPGQHSDYFDIRLIIPMLHYGHILNISGRKTDYSARPEKYVHLKGVKVNNLYNEAAMGDAVWVFEGHPDTLSGIELGLPAVGVVGTSGLTCPEKLANAKEIYICGDNDGPGRVAVEQWARKILEHNKTGRILFVTLPDGIKDFNEWHLANRGPGLQQAFNTLQAGAKDIINYKISQLNTTDDLVTLWPYLGQVTEIQREQAFRLIKGKLPSCGIKLLRNCFTEWRAATAMSQGGTSSQVLNEEIAFERNKMMYLNVDFSFVEDPVAHICLYGTVPRLDENGHKSFTEEPILIRSTIDQDGHYQPQQILVLDDAKLMTLKGMPLKRSSGNRWSHDSIKRFLARLGPEISTYDLANGLSRFFQKYIWFQNPVNYDVLAFYTMGTYLARMFDSFPYLTINGLKRTGKSNTLDLLQHLCFNPTLSVNNTIAATFRLIHSNFCTLIRDEAEQFNVKTPENTDELTILNSGYKCGSRVTRVEKDAKGNMEAVEFEVYSPKIFGGINVLNTTLLDRAILIKSHRAPKEVVMNMPRMIQESAKWRAEADDLRDQIYTWMLTKFYQVKYITDHYPPSDAIINREWELWLPLLSIALLADKENPEAESEANKDSFTRRLLRFAKEKGDEKREIEQDDTRELAILEAIHKLIEDNEVGAVLGHPLWYPVQNLANKVTELLKNEGLLKKDWEITSRKLTRLLDQTQVLSNRAEDVKQIWQGGKNQKCVLIRPDALMAAIAAF